jgi:hypothetical protein
VSDDTNDKKLDLLRHAKSDDAALRDIGLDIRVASDKECATVDYMVCVTLDTPTRFTDNKVSNCAICGVPIQYRPYMPEKPTKVCIKCFMKVVQPS